MRDAQSGSYCSTVILLLRWLVLHDDKLKLIEPSILCLVLDVAADFLRVPADGVHEKTLRGPERLW